MNQNNHNSVHPMSTPVKTFPNDLIGQNQGPKFGSISYNLVAFEDLLMERTVSLHFISQNDCLVDSTEISDYSGQTRKEEFFWRYFIFSEKIPLEINARSISFSTRKTGFPVRAKSFLLPKVYAK